MAIVEWNCPANRIYICHVCCGQRRVVVDGEGHLSVCGRCDGWGRIAETIQSVDSFASLDGYRPDQSIQWRKWSYSEDPEFDALTRDTVPSREPPLPSSLERRMGWLREESRAKRRRRRGIRVAYAPFTWRVENAGRLADYQSSGR